MYFNFHSPRRIEVTEDMVLNSVMRYRGNGRELLQRSWKTIHNYFSKKGLGVFHHFAHDRRLYKFEPNASQAGGAANGNLAMFAPVSPRFLCRSADGQESMLSVVKDNAAQLLKQFGLEDDMDRLCCCCLGKCKSTT